jgi:hypothetical protein
MLLRWRANLVNKLKNTQQDATKQNKNKHKINAHTDIHVSSGIQTRDYSVRGALTEIRETTMDRKK